MQGFSKRSSMLLNRVRSSSSSRLVLQILLLLVVAAFTINWIHNAINSANNTPVISPQPATQISTSCPAYFRWIHEDLRPWSSTGISLEAVESAAAEHANFRLVVVDGRAYIKHHPRVLEERDIYNLWGFLQLLRRYPGRVPNLDLMFKCNDNPIVRSADYNSTNSPSPPPLFRYCKNDTTLDILFPDWSFWGWPNKNIKPWVKLVEEMKEGNKRLKWDDREPFAYWKGTLWDIPSRQDLLKCNVSEDRDWNARIYGVDWVSESEKGFKDSHLANQCHHRYKIYNEGFAWSASAKYIMACDSPTLMVVSRYQEFLTRGLIPGQHYWPISADDKCRSIKFAVDWGNSHPEQAQQIGKEGSRFVQEQVSMDYVYDYMLHLLTEYAKLLRYEPSIPDNAVELTLDSMLGLVGENTVIRAVNAREFMMESMITSPHDSTPCSMPPPFSSEEIKEFIARKENSIKQVEMMERESLKN